MFSNRPRGIDDDDGDAPGGRNLIRPEHRAMSAVPALRGIPDASTAGGFFASLLAWREKQFAVRLCDDLLTLHDIVAAFHPALIGAPLYRQIVAAHRGGDFAFAEAVIDSAEQSFAIWPVQRPLRFADVVHYLAANELLAMSRRARWIHADLKRIVAARIPHHL